MKVDLVSIHRLKNFTAPSDVFYEMGAKAEYHLAEGQEPTFLNKLSHRAFFTQAGVTFYPHSSDVEVYLGWNPADDYNTGAFSGKADTLFVLLNGKRAIEFITDTEQISDDRLRSIVETALSDLHAERRRADPGGRYTKRAADEREDRAAEERRQAALRELD